MLAFALLPSQTEAFGHRQRTRSRWNDSAGSLVAAGEVVEVMHGVFHVWACAHVSDANSRDEPRRYVCRYRKASSASVSAIYLLRCTSTEIHRYGLLQCTHMKALLRIAWRSSNIDEHGNDQPREHDPYGYIQTAILTAYTKPPPSAEPILLPFPISLIRKSFLQLDPSPSFTTRSER